ncbi:MAG: peptidylprolyl isomerase [Lachnospiraceae bacterium]|nr:peptidylprolyl isomerase [Lachnospiraceae bacterium]
MKKQKCIAVIVAAAILLSGCSVAGKTVFFSFAGPFTVFSIGPLSCGRTEAKVYLANYKNLYGRVGDTDLWNGDFDTTEVEEGVKTAAINHLSKVYSLDLYARENDIELDEDEKNQVAAAAKEYTDSLSETDVDATGANLGSIRKMYEHYALAEKVYSMLMDSVDEEVSEDEARIMDAYVLYVTDKKTYRRLAKQIKNGATFERLVSSFSEGDKGEVSFGRGTYPEEVEEVAFALEDDEISDGIETDDGYYFVQCIDKYNEELSEENKKKIIAGRKEDLVQNIVSDQYDKYDSQINTKLWERMHIETKDDVQTDSFFVTIENYLSY